MNKQETLVDELQTARKQIKTDSYSMSIGEIINLYRDEDLILNPAFQRLFRWNDDQKTKFIESIGHGSQLDLSSINNFDLNLKSLAELKDIIFAIIDSFQDDLLEYATEKYYLAKKAENKRAYDEQASQELEKIFRDIESKYSSQEFK